MTQQIRSFCAQHGIRVRHHGTVYSVADHTLHSTTIGWVLTRQVDTDRVLYSCHTTLQRGLRALARTVSRLSDVAA
jgi:hypothetical protein